MKKVWILLLSVAGVVALVSGCGVAVDNTAVNVSGADINPQPRDNIRDGGTLTTAIGEVSPQWNTWQADATAYTLALWRWYNPVLAFFTPDGQYHPNPAYLTRVDKAFVDGKTVVTYTINPKAFYNDGTPIDYRAFVATWETSRGTDERYIVSSTDGYDQIASVTRGVNDRQVVVRFKGVWAWPDGLFNILLHPKAANPDFYNKGYVQQPHPELGAGPFTLDTYDPHDRTVTFKRNPKWWGNPGKLDRRVFRQLESQAAIGAFQNGELDSIGVASKDARARVITMSGIDIRTSATPSQSLMVVNLDTPILSDIRVREALLRGVDRATLARIEFTGLNYSEPLPGSLTMYPFQPGYEDNVKGVIDYDEAKAKSILDAAGWKEGDDGIRNKDGQRLSLTLPILGDDVGTQNMARALQAMMRKIGIDLLISQRPTTDFSQVIVNKEFDIFLMGFSSSDPFGMAYLCQIWCKGSQLNKAGAGSVELDRKIAAVAQIPDPMAQIAAGNKVEREAFAQYSNLPLTNGPTMVAVKKGLANSGAGLFFVGPVEDIGWQK